MSKLVLIVLPDFYADWEIGFLAPMFHSNADGQARSMWEAKTVSLNKGPIRSMGGFKVTPDLSLEEVPEEFDALIMIGGQTWRRPESQAFIELVERAKKLGKPVAAICDAANFLGWNGFLDQVSHTGNAGGGMIVPEIGRYQGEKNFDKKARVKVDQGFITADGASPLEFSEAVLRELKVLPDEEIDGWVESYRVGEKAYWGV